jgi:hypothetical protein
MKVANANLATAAKKQIGGLEIPAYTCGHLMSVPKSHYSVRCACSMDWAECIELGPLIFW